MYDKHPTIILQHFSNYPSSCSKAVSVFSGNCILVGDITTLYGLAKGFLTNDYEISFSLSQAIKNALSLTDRSIYILSDI